MVTLLPCAGEDAASSLCSDLATEARLVYREEPDTQTEPPGSDPTPSTFKGENQNEDAKLPHRRSAHVSVDHDLLNVSGACGQLLQFKHLRFVLGPGYLPGFFPDGLAFVTGFAFDFELSGAGTTSTGSASIGSGVTRFVFDGQGHYTRTLILAAPLPTCTFTDTGTYHINLDGTGTWTSSSLVSSTTPCTGTYSVSGTFILGIGGQQIHASEAVTASCVMSTANVVRCNHQRYKR